MVERKERDVWCSSCSCPAHAQPRYGERNRGEPREDDVLARQGTLSANVPGELVAEPGRGFNTEAPF